jgi:diacylglycerol kinase (ATP)
MKKAKILHNPSAGKQELTKKNLVKLVKDSGFECGYSSTKAEGWKTLQPKTDFFIIAGGDGTVRKIVVNYLVEHKHHIRPILLLPLGTANNIAKSLGIQGKADEIITNIHNGKFKKFDVGRIRGKKKEMFFLESFGFGVFPQLMRRMEEIPEREDAAPEENIITALDELHRIVLSYPGKPFTVVVDGLPHTDHYILVEVMNIASIGPNLFLSQKSDPGDGEFELVMIPESQRQEFADYITARIKGVETGFSPVVIKGKKIAITAPAGSVHIDDQLKKLKKPKNLNIEPMSGMLEFFVQ